MHLSKTFSIFLMLRTVSGDAIALAELAKWAADRNVQSPRVYFSALMAGPSHLQGDKLKHL